MPTEISFPTGVDIIRHALRDMPAKSGVYRMIGDAGEVLYIGKAKYLNARVVNYTNLAQLPLRLQRMVMATRSMEITITGSEAEALLLEANLIKTVQPRYNILLRDDKSFPYIQLSAHAFPRIGKYRGNRNDDGKYFGPFVSAGAVNETLSLLQKAFLLRSCSDNVFSHRTRPCLQYQIKRCSAPCVDYISEEGYASLTAQAVRFLSGKGREIQTQLATEMEALSAAKQFEKAAILRDRIRALTHVQQKGYGAGIADADVFALHRVGDVACIQVVAFRGGHEMGHRSFFPSHTEGRSDEDIVSTLLGQYYQSMIPPREVLVSHALLEAEVLGEALSLLAKGKVEVLFPQRGDKREAVQHALRNAKEALQSHISAHSHQRDMLQALATCFGLNEPPARIEVYDNSHISGTHAVGAMIVACEDGFMKKGYRIFNIRSEELSPGDDYAMLREVLTRRFRRLLEESDTGVTPPDLVLIDGGAGQLSVAASVFEQLGISDIPYAAISKGPDRNAGREFFHLPQKEPFQLPPNDPLLHYLQRLRDEAHRFAIGAHRGRRSRAISQSGLDAISGVGGARKKALLVHFGSAKAVSAAGVADLKKVAGVSEAMAQRIYDHFHGQ